MSKELERALELLQRVINGELRGGGSLRGQIRDFLASQQRGKFVATGQYVSPPKEELVWSAVGAGGPKNPEQAESAQEGREAIPDKGPWHAIKWDGGKRVDLSSDDFTHDVALTVSGDFATADDKFRYAEQMAAWMNAALAQPSPAQDHSEQSLAMVELERPKVAGYLNRHSGQIAGLSFDAMFDDSEPLMTVAQHERIDAARLACVRLLADEVLALSAQRDSALAKLAAMEQQEPVGFANFRNGRYGSWLHPDEASAKSFDATSIGGKPGNSKQVALYAHPVAQAGQVPDGCALVPVEPSTGMLDVAVSHALMVSLSGDYNWSAYMRDVWQRMLAAAPAQGGK